MSAQLVWAPSAMLDAPQHDPWGAPAPSEPPF